jgi:hypothetical protein
MPGLAHGAANRAELARRLRWQLGGQRARCGLTVLAIASFVAGLWALLGELGLILAALTMVLIGNPRFSGVGSAPELLPEPAGAIGQLMPPGRREPAPQHRVLRRNRCRRARGGLRRLDARGAGRPTRRGSRAPASRDRAGPDPGWLTPGWTARGSPPGARRRRGQDTGAQFKSVASPGNGASSRTRLSPAQPTTTNCSVAACPDAYSARAKQVSARVRSVLSEVVRSERLPLDLGNSRNHPRAEVNWSPDRSRIPTATEARRSCRWGSPICSVGLEPSGCRLLVGVPLVWADLLFLPLGRRRLRYRSLPGYGARRRVAG